MLDFDLAELYEVETRILNQAVKRNTKRFPEDFMFQVTWEEMKNLKSQFVISSWGGTRKRPYAFTEQGVAMLSSVLRSEKAIDTNVAIMRAFVAIRRYAMTFDELAAKIISHDKELADINEVLRWLGEENQARADEITAREQGLKNNTMEASGNPQQSHLEADKFSTPPKMGAFQIVASRAEVRSAHI